MITIFTATYNRAYILPQLYESICKQTNRDFEWIVIDDDSTDDTEDLVRRWQLTSGFKLIYQKQEHGGKHRAINRGVKMAAGDFFFIVDSDDSLMPNSIELIKSWIASLDGREDICAVSGTRVSSTGQIWGGDPSNVANTYIDASNFDRFKYKLCGDKAEVYKTSILRKYPFPEFEGEDFVTEEVCWDAIAAAGYKIRWYNVPIYVSEYLDDGLSKTGANDLVGHKKNYKGFCYWFKVETTCRPLHQRWQMINEYRKTVDSMGKTNRECAKDLGYSLFYYLVVIYVIWAFSRFTSKSITAYRIIRSRVLG